jgi:hypothetical protein
MNHVTPPTRVQVIPHVSGTTVGVSVGGTRTATAPVTIVGTIRFETKLDIIRPAIVCLLSREVDSPV